ncbi:DMT family transporter [Mitsuaria sp. WAJ17]|uniref:DMT family transporter n=1 Tax=Mitsuaria sp. WAJ17 TaxID=2761452 RepID=UPI0016015B87|nr:DMT family transporter [Mitsuaria sp. WAJ17]MBB2483812.1 DMT family transporter [Mitsuaria sp. WAJ17]
MAAQGTQARSGSGWIHGFIGMLIFSGSMPATRVAVADFDPVFLTVARASLAGALALLALLLTRSARPTRLQWRALGVVSGGVVLGFPLLTALALQQLSSAHALLFLGLLPLSTAGFAVLRGGERPRPAFWLCAVLGSSLVVGHALSRGPVLQGSLMADGLMLAAVLVCGLGYAEGARLARTLGGWQVICWALVLALPLSALGAWLTQPASFSGVRHSAWLGLAYVSLFSMLIGFVFWYRGLALGGIAAVGQLQLLQPLFGLVLAAWLLQEAVSAGMLGVTVGVLACVAVARRLET